MDGPLPCQIFFLVPMCGMDHEHSPDEVRALVLLKEVQQTLAIAVQSLNDKAPPPARVDCLYLQSAAALVNRAVDGYVVLREACRVDASKLLIRPALEIVFAGTAIVRTPGFLTRKAYSEWREEQKMFPEPAAKAAAEQDFENFKRQFLRDNPGYPVDYRPVSTEDLAKEAGMGNIYNTTYRTYCKFTHGALGTVHGGLNEVTDRNDTQLLSSCVMVMLELLKQHTPAQVPDLTSLRARLLSPA